MHLFKKYSHHYHHLKNDSHSNPSKNLPILTLSVMVILSAFFLVSDDIYTLMAFAQASESSHAEIGEAVWVKPVFWPIESGAIIITDSDMNIDSKSIDSFVIDVWSDSDTEGIGLTVTEIMDNSGVFTGSVIFSTKESSDGTLRVAPGDRITARYVDETLPSPYMTSDKIDIVAESNTGFPINQRCMDYAGCDHRRLQVVDPFGNTLDDISVNQQVQLTSDLANGQNRDQNFVYIVQIKNNENVVVSLKWLTGTFSPGQSFSPALPWVPSEAGTFTATAFAWDSIENGYPWKSPISTKVEVYKKS